MPKTTSLNIEIDQNLKTQADILFGEMGMNFATAVNVFVRQAVSERAMPFKIYREAEDTRIAASVEQRRAAMQEIRDLLTNIDGNIDLEQIKAERRAAKFEHNG